MIVVITQDVKSYEKNPSDTAHVEWLAHLRCGHTTRYDPTKFSNPPHTLPTQQRCDDCAAISRTALGAHGIG